jgi:hypothetical protein
MILALEKIAQGLTADGIDDDHENRCTEIGRCHSFL